MIASVVGTASSHTCASRQQLFSDSDDNCFGVAVQSRLVGFNGPARASSAIASMRAGHPLRKAAAATYRRAVAVLPRAIIANASSAAPMAMAQTPDEDATVEQLRDGANPHEPQ